VFGLILPEIILGYNNFITSTFIVIILFIISFTFRKIFLSKFNYALKLYKNEKLTESLNEFKFANEFYIKYNFIDKFRFILLLDNSKKTYHEMSLLNIANLYNELGDEKESINTFRDVLKLFPKSAEAKQAIEDNILINQGNSNLIHKDIQISLNKKKLLKYLLLTLLFILPSPLIIIDNSISILMKIILSLCFIFILTTIIFYVLKLLDTKPGLIVNNKGFIDNSSMASFNFIEWKYVTSINYRQVGRFSFVKVTLSNFDEMLNKQPFRVRLLSKINPTEFDNGFNISAIFLDCSLPELKNILRNGKRNYHYA